jgi:hypothetical protein
VLGVVVEQEILPIAVDSWGWASVEFKPGSCAPEVDTVIFCALQVLQGVF